MDRLDHLHPAAAVPFPGGLRRFRTVPAEIDEKPQEPGPDLRPVKGPLDLELLQDAPDLLRRRVRDKGRNGGGRQVLAGRQLRGQDQAGVPAGPLGVEGMEAVGVDHRQLPGVQWDAPGLGDGDAAALQAEKQLRGLVPVEVGVAQVGVQGIDRAIHGQHGVLIDVGVVFVIAHGTFPTPL